MITRIFIKKASIKQLSNLNARYVISSSKLKKSNGFDRVSLLHSTWPKYFSNQNLSLLHKSENKEEKVSNYTELEELLGDFRNSDPKFFNRTTTFQTIKKYVHFCERPDNTVEDLQRLFGEDFNIFLTKIIENIKIFEENIDLGKVLDFLIPLLQKNVTLTEKLGKNLISRNLLSIDYENLNKIVHFFGIKAVHCSKVSKFNVHMKSILKIALSKSTPKDSIRLLALFNKVVSGPNYSAYGGKNEEIVEILRTNYSIYSKEWKTYDFEELAFLHQFYFDSTKEDVRELLSNIEEKLIQNLNQITNKSLVLLIYNISHSNLVNPEYWAVLEEQVIDRINDIHPNELTAVIISFARFDQGSVDLYMEIDRNIGNNIESLDYNNVPCLAWTYANSGKYREKFFFLLEEVILEYFDDYSLKDLSTILWAYSSVFQLNQTLFTRLQSKFFENIDKLNYEEMENVWSALLLQKVDDRFFVASEDKILELLNTPEASNNSEFLGTLFEGFSSHNSSLKKLGPSLKKALVHKFNNLGESEEEQVFLLKLGKIVADNIKYFVNQKDFIQALRSRVEASKKLCNDDSERKMTLQYFLVRIDSIL